MRTPLASLPARFATIVFVATLMCVVGFPAVGSTPRRSEQPRNARLRDRELVIGNKGTRSIVIDGDLADWVGAPVGQGFTQQQIDNLANPVLTTDLDAATVRLMRDDEALYVAVQVADKVVTNDYQGRVVYQGDCVELFFDARPLVSATEPILGDSRYSDGVCQLMFVPPTDKGEPFRWRNADPQSTLGAFDAEAKRIEGGYSIELRIPFASFNGATAGRFQSPIGFDMLVDDSDSPDNGQPVYNVYSWGGEQEGYMNASRLGTAQSSHGRATRTQVLRADAPRLKTESGKSTLHSALLTASGKIDRPAPPRWQTKFEASAFEAVQTQTAASPSPIFIPGEGRVTEYPQFGVTLRQDTLNIEGSKPGRYSFAASYPDAKAPVRMAHFYGISTDSGVQLQPVSSAATAADALTALAGTYIFVELEDNFPYIGERIKGSFEFSPEPAILWQLSAKTAQLLKSGGDRFYGLLVVMLNDRDKVVRQSRFALKHAKEKMPFSMEGLPAGQYTLRIRAVDPQGLMRPVRYKYQWGTQTHTREPGSPVTVIPPRDILLKTTVADSPHLLHHATELGSPNRERFPLENWADSYARGVRELHLFEGRIFIGCGDWNANRGPIDIWSFAPVTAAAAADFRKEFTVDDESVDVMRHFGSRLYVPGIDARESWEFGNLYVREDGKWTKLRTVPNGLHVLDAAEFEGKLYVSTGTETGAQLFESLDSGKSWRIAGEDAGEGRFGRMVALRDSLLVMTHYDARPFLLREGKRNVLKIPPFPRQGKSFRQSANRLIAFGEGAVYSGTPEMLGLKDRMPLFYMGDFEKGAVMVEQFRNEQVRDIKVDDGICYILTGRQTGTFVFNGELYSSRDLRNWTRLASFDAPALPASLAVASGNYYVGLGVASSWEATDSMQVANAASGSVWVLKE